MLKTDIAFKTDINEGFLPFITAFMVFLASIIFATALTGNNIAKKWDEHLSNNIIIQILPDSSHLNPEKEIEEKIKNIKSILKQTAGVKSYSAMTKDETKELLKPWLGNFIEDKSDFTLPRIINIEKSDVIPLDIKSLKKDIENYSSLIKIETYETWMYDFKKTLSAIQNLLGVIIFIILLTTAITISYATKSGLNINKKVINIMHMVGATNEYITSQFSKQMMKLAIQGGLIGYMFSCITILVVKKISLGLNDGAIANFNFSGYIYLYILIIPITAGIISRLTAIITIKKELNGI